MMGRDRYEDARQERYDHHRREDYGDRNFQRFQSNFDRNDVRN